MWPLFNCFSFHSSDKQSFVEDTHPKQKQKTYNVGKALACKIVVKANISKFVFVSKQKNLPYNEVLKRFCLLFRTAELREKIETLNGEIQQLDMDLEEHQGKHLSLQIEFSLFTTEKRIWFFK